MKKIVFGLIVIVISLTGCSTNASYTPVCVTNMEREMCFGKGYTAIFENNIRTLNITVLAQKDSDLLQGMLFAETKADLAPSPGIVVDKFSDKPETWQIHQEVDQFWTANRVTKTGDNK